MAKYLHNTGRLWDRWSERKHYNRSHLELYYRIRERNLKWLASCSLSLVSDKRDLKILKTDLWNEAKKDGRFFQDASGSRLGIDISGKICKQAKARCQERLSIVNGNIESLPFMSDSIDLIWDISTIDHCKYPENVISEYNRILKPNGILLLIAENPFCLSYPVTKIQSFLKYHVPFKGFSPSRIIRACGRAGLEVIDHFKTNVHLPRFIVYPLERKGLLEGINCGRNVLWDCCKKYFVTLSRKI